MNRYIKTASVIFSAVCLLCIAAVTASATSATPATSAAGIKKGLEELTAVYTDGVYFTSDGLVCYSAYDDRCNILNIPSRGGLPAGTEVAACDWQGESWSCRAFSNYVWYHLFGCHYTNSANELTNEVPVLGDFIKFNNGWHTAIYLWQDSQYYYVYDANGESDCEVHFAKKFNKEKWTITSISHAYNYNEVCNSVSPQFTRPISAVYRITNVATGRALSDTFKLVTLNDTNKAGTRLSLKAGETNFAISAESNPGTYLALTADGQLTTSTTATSSARWKLLTIGEKAFIHNSKYPGYLLYDNGGSLAVGTYTGKARQLWTVEHADHNFVAEVVTPPTCTEVGFTKYVCICGKVFYEYTSETGHDWKTETVKATASVCGYTKKKCSKCGLVVRENLTKRTGDETVNTKKVKVIGDSVIVNPNITEEQLCDLFPDFTSDNEAGLKYPGATIKSSIDSRTYKVIIAGDTNENGKLTVSDARVTLRMAIGLSKTTDYALLYCDWTSDGIIDTTDARLQLRLVLGKETGNELVENIYMAKLLF